MSGRLNLTIEQGSTFSRVVTITNSEGNPVNITSSTFSGQIRKRYGSTDVEATFTCIVTDGANGKLSVQLTAEQTAACSTGDLVYDIEWYNSNNTARLLEGTATITPEVTR